MMTICCAVVTSFQARSTSVDAGHDRLLTAPSSIFRSEIVILSMDFSEKLVHIAVKAVLCLSQAYHQLRRKFAERSRTGSMNYRQTCFLSRKNRSDHDLL